MRSLSAMLVMAAVLGLGYVLGHAFTDQYPVTVSSTAPAWILPADDGAAVPVAAPVTQQKASKSKAPKSPAGKVPGAPRLHTPKIHQAVSHLPLHHSVYVPHPRVAHVSVRHG